MGDRPMKTRNILLGITGGIAAYKAPELVRRLTERGATVQVVMTAAAARFVTPTTLQAVSGRPVRDSLWDEAAEAAMSHIELARWADQILIAPATADCMAQLAAGAAGDLLTTLCLASEAPLAIAPAMNRVMWASPAVQANRAVLERRGVRILGPDAGDQACGEQGLGRMSDPAAIATQLLEGGDHGPAAGVSTAGPLAGKTVMITAGPTREAIDPVRFLSNRSSGKMGYAMAEAALAAGARVILVSGPVALETPAGAEVVAVESAEDLYRATMAHLTGVDIFIGAAAVADYKPRQRADQKIKKSRDAMSIELTRTPDTLAAVAARDPAPFTVGFAAETTRLQHHARIKLEAKKLDMIIANEVGPDRGFDKDDNAVVVCWRGGLREFPKAPKTQLARDLVTVIADRFRQRSADAAQPDVIALRNRT